MLVVPGAGRGIRLLDILVNRADDGINYATKFVMRTHIHANRQADGRVF